MSALKAHPVAITTFDHRADLLSLLSRSPLKTEIKGNEDILQLPFPYSYTEEGISTEVVGYVVNKIVDDLKKTDHTVIIDVPSLLNVTRILKDEMHSLGIQDEIVDGRVICLTYDENNLDNSKPVFTTDIEEGIRIAEEYVDKRSVAYVTLKDPDGGCGYLLDFIFNIQDRINQLNMESNQEAYTSEWGLDFPNLLEQKHANPEKQIILPTFDDVIEIDIKDAWKRLSGLSNMGKIVYADKKIREQRPQLGALPEKILNRIIFI